jgi:hypothetical protein
VAAEHVYDDAVRRASKNKQRNRAVLERRSRSRSSKKPLFSVLETKLRQRELVAAKFSWLEFQVRTQEALIALGFSLRPSVHRDEEQMNFIATRTDEFGTTEYVVECTNSDIPIGIQETRQLRARVSERDGAGRRTRGMLISARGFTVKARRYADQHGIITSTLAALQDKSLDATPLLIRATDAFKRDLSARYIDLSCAVTESGKSTIYRPVEKFLEKHLSTTTAPGVAILGNFGAGKTSFCKRYAHLLASRRTTSQSWQDSDPIPVVISLRNWPSFVAIESNLLNDLRNIPGLERTTEAGLTLWLRHARYVLMLDGFDEMAARMDRVAVRDNLGYLRSFAKRISGKIILTCRTHFFRSMVEEDHLAGFLRLYIQDWGRREMEQYVAKHCGAKSASIVEGIRRTYNLEELAKTPIFLGMIVESRDRLSSAPASGFHTTQLYQLYTNQWFEEQERSRPLSAAPDLLKEMIQSVAYELFRSGKTTLAAGEISVLLRKEYGVGILSSLDSFASAVQTATFLVRTGDSYHFAHKSYLEFFAGLHLAIRLKSGRLNELTHVALTREVADFAAGFFLSDDDCAFLVDLFRGEHDPRLRSNIALMLSSLVDGPGVLSALVDSLKGRPADTVLDAVVAALLTCGKPEASDAVLAAHESDDRVSDSCVFALTGAGGLGTAGGMFLERLARSYDAPSPAARRVLGAMAARECPLSEEMIGKLRDPRWLADLKTARALITMLGHVQNLPAAIEGYRIVERSRASQRAELMPTYEDAKRRSQTAFRDDVRKRVHSNRERRLEYSSNQGEVLSYFGELVNPEHLKSLLDGIYGESDGLPRSSARERKHAKTKVAAKEKHK